MSETKKKVTDTPKKLDKKGARFLRVFGLASTPELVEGRIRKITEALDELSIVARNVEIAGGDPAEFRQRHMQLVKRLDDIKKSADASKDKDSNLALLKEQARVAAKEATLRAPDVIEVGRLRREESDEALRKLIATRRKDVEKRMLVIEILLRNAAGPLPSYTSQYEDLKQDCLNAANEADLEKAERRWWNLVPICAGLVTNIPVAAACIEPAKAADFWLGKIDSAVAALRPDEELDEEGVKRAKALRDKVAELYEYKDLADNGKLANRRGYLLDICDQASVEYAPLKQSELAATLPSKDHKKAHDDALDELALSLSGNEDLETQATMRAAIALRFGVEFATSDEFANPLGAGIKKLGALYDVMKMVPAAHLTAADGTMQISYKEAVPGVERANKFAKREVSAEQGGGKLHTIVMTLPTDGETIKKTNAKGEETELEFFQSTALHEIGHAVDDKERFMERHRSNVGYGQWEPSSRVEVQQKYVALLEKTVGNGLTADVTSYVDACLNGQTPKQPAASNEPLHALLPHWKALATVGDTMRGIRERGALWYKGGGGATAAAIDGRVYFEAYPDQWWSFVRAEREASVADYQWRAPGEWFAEAYSLYYLGKLPGDHPVAVWCSA